MQRPVRFALAAALAAAVTIPLAQADSGRPNRVSRLNDRQLAGQRIVAGFDGRHIPGHLRTRIRRGAVAGVILFSDNYSGVDGARRLADRLQGIPRRAPLRGVPLLIMLDQEGGIVKRLPGPPCCSAEAMGGMSRARVRQEGADTGHLLRQAGVNVDLAPVLDVARPGSAIGAQDRAFGSTAGQVTRKGDTFAAGLQSTGVAATGKHFPGLGAAPQDTDFAVQHIGLRKRVLRAVDEAPYDRFERLGGDMVMLSTAIYTHLDPSRPGALSRAVATQELRGRAGFTGVSISDALDTVSARDAGGPSALARQGARAGTDLLLYTAVGDAAKAAHALGHALENGSIPRRNFLRSARRVVHLRAGLPG